MLKIGIAGARGTSTILGFQAMEGVEVAAVCDLDETVMNKIADEHHIGHRYRVFDDMLAADIDAVVVATPMQLHVPQAIAALEAGKHVLSEVTAGVTMDELYWLMESVEKSGKTYMLAENYCYTPENQIIRRMVKDGLFGRPYYGEGEYLHDMRHRMVLDGGKTSWRKYWQMGKRGTFYPTHSIGPLMQWFEGDHIEEITTYSPGKNNPSDFRQDDMTVTMCRLASGRLLRIRLDCTSPRPHNLFYYQLQGTQGAYEAPRGLGDDHKVWLEGFDESTEVAKWRPLTDFAHLLPERYKQATQAQQQAAHGGGDFFIVQDFVDAVRTGNQPAVDVYQACEWTAVAILSELSVTNGSRAMRMPRFRKGMPLREQITTIAPI